jgi:hypothetical protein
VQVRQDEHSHRHADACDCYSLGLEVVRHRVGAGAGHDRLALRLVVHRQPGRDQVRSPVGAVVGSWGLGHVVASRQDPWAGHERCRAWVGPAAGTWAGRQGSGPCVPDRGGGGRRCGRGRKRGSVTRRV